MRRTGLLCFIREKIVALGTVEEIRNGHNQIVDAFVRGKEIREEAVQ